MSRIYTGVIDNIEKDKYTITTKRKGVDKRSMIGYHVLGKFKGNIIGLKVGDAVKITYKDTWRNHKIIKIEKINRIADKEDKHDVLSGIRIKYYEQVETLSLYDKIFDTKWKKERRRIITEKYMKSILRKEQYNLSLGIPYEII